MSPRTERDLSWDLVLFAVARRSQHPLCDVRVVPLADSFVEMERAQRQTAEALSLLSDGDPLPLGGICEVDGSLQRLERQGQLAGPELVSLCKTLRVAEYVRRFLSKRKDRAPLLLAACHVDPSLADLAEDMMELLEPDGRITDDASSVLTEKRHEASGLRARITGRLDQLVQEKQSLLSDRFYTLREGRYVLPVRTDAHEKVHGIVHGTSQTGATIFLEPRELVPRGNRLKLLEGEIEREELRILAELSARFFEHVAAARSAAEALLLLDLRAASAQLAYDFGGVMPRLVDTPRLHLKAARHPLLVLDASEGGAEVVPNDLSIQAGEGLVLSGPNAGGKTVGLKILGLAALMVRAGLPVFAAEGSVAGFYAQVMTEMGDAQSLEQNLSTFSAHMQNLSGLLARLSKGSLVLLDEVGTGTDPSDGGAIACAIVEAVCEAGASVAVTTHYDALKAFAAEHPRLTNASVGFDVADMRPTFALHLGVPGSSSALAVAARFGLPADVLRRAGELRPRHADAFQTLLGQVEEVRARLLEREEALDERDRNSAAEAERLDREKNALRKEAGRALREEIDALRDALSTARSSVQQIKKELRAPGVAEDQLKDAQAALREAGILKEKAERALAKQAEAPRERARELAAEGTPIVKGARVWLPTLRTEGVVTTDPDPKGRVRVAAGPVRMLLAGEDVQLLEGARPAESDPKSLQGKRSVAPAVRTQDNTVDLRGMDAEDARAMAEAFLDRLYARDERTVFLLHGHGDGVLRNKLRKYLAGPCPYANRFHPARHEDGGDAVTVVEFTE